MERADWSALAPVCTRTSEKSCPIRSSRNDRAPGSILWLQRFFPPPGRRGLRRGFSSMAARVRLSTRDLSVQPGAQVVVDCLITNTGLVVDEFHVTVLGDTARWAEVGPPIRLMP